MLSKEFLAPYVQRGDNFPSLLARASYLSKYKRNEDDHWTATIRRVVEGNCALDPRVTTEEAEQLFHVFWTMQALPPGRGLWVGGVPNIPNDAAFNCFSGDTRFWANGELVSLRDMVGREFTVICKDGVSRPATVRSFGTQHLYTFEMRPLTRSKFRMKFQATANHRWFTSNRGEVTDLKCGDRIRVVPREIDKEDPQYILGKVHGMVFADGSKERDQSYRLRLCGQKAVYKEFLQRHPWFTTSSTPPSFGGDPLVHFRTDQELKDVPAASTSLEYQAGFLAGWMLLDGSVRPAGNGSNRLSCASSVAVNWLLERAPLLGYCVAGIIKDKSTKTNFGVRKSPLRVVTLLDEAAEYQVSRVIDEGVEEEVFCVVEQATHSFTLEGGVVTGNCWFSMIYAIEDWGWVANQLMLGGGVGVGLEKVNILPGINHGDDPFLHVGCAVTHPNVQEVMPDASFALVPELYKVDDSREGWVGALNYVMHRAWDGRTAYVDVSRVRQRGAPIRTFGGTACGPGPLTDMLRSVWGVIRGAAGRRITTVEGLDITNFIGKCVKAGNVRRSALIALGAVDDQEFRDAKKNLDAILSHRHTSNNSLNFHEFSQFTNFDWTGLVRDNIEFGEPGIDNLALGKLQDPFIEGVNPCGEVQLRNRESCNLAEVFPALFDGSVRPERIFQLVTRYALRQRLLEFEDRVAEEARKQTMRLGVGLGGITDFEWTEDLLRHYYLTVSEEANKYADELGVTRPIAKTTVKPSGTISLLNGSDPGIHAAEAPFYVRRMRISDSEPMAVALAEAGVPWEYDVYDNTNHTMVFSFPMKARNPSITALNQSLADQFERQLKVQRAWADNAVSSTIKFDKDEADDMARYLSHYAPMLKSISMLPKSHGYAQAPYEPIDEQQFAQLHAAIDHRSSLAVGDLQIDDCEHGVCPIR